MKLNFWPEDSSTLEYETIDYCIGTDIMKELAASLFRKVHKESLLDYSEMETANTLKFWHLYIYLHSVITQNTDMFISTNMRTSNAASSDLICLHFNLVKPTFENVNVKTA